MTTDDPSTPPYEQRPAYGDQQPRYISQPQQPPRRQEPPYLPPPDWPSPPASQYPWQQNPQQARPHATSGPPYFNFERAELDMRAALAAGDGVRYAEIHRLVAAARGEVPAYPVAVPAQKQWPMVLDVQPAQLATYAPCSAGQRFGAWLIDWGCYYVLWIIFAVLGVAVPFVGIFLFLALIGGGAANQWFMGSTGQSLGKKAVGIYLVNEATRLPPGGWTGIGRWLLHLLDTFSLGIGWIIGLASGQTFADRIVHTIVVAKPVA